MVSDMTQMLVQSGLQSVQNSPIDNLGKGIQQGAQLAQTVQNMQTQREELEIKKQQNELNKIDKVLGAIETGLTKVPKRAQKAYFEGMRNNVAGPLKIGLTDSFFEALMSPDVNQGALGQTMVSFRTAVRDGMRTGDFSSAQEMASPILEAFGGDVTKFGDYMNTAMGSEASAYAQEVEANRKAKEYMEEPQQASAVEESKKVSALFTEWNKEGGDAGAKSRLEKLKAAKKSLQSGKVNLGGFTTQIPYGSDPAVMARINKDAKQLSDNVQSTINIKLLTGDPNPTAQQISDVRGFALDPRLDNAANIEKIDAQIAKEMRAEENLKNLFLKHGKIKQSSGAKDGDTKEWQGKKYKVVKGKWVEVK